MNYISYWIPLTNTIDINFITASEPTRIPIRENISDGIIIEESFIEIKFLENKNIFFQFEDNSYTLICKSFNDKGLLTYYFNNLAQNIKDIIEIQVYHFIKSYFHKHESHEDKVDALLHGYFTSTLPDDDYIVKHFCDIFQDKFNEYIENIESAGSIPDILSKYKNKEYSIEEALNFIAKIQNKILNIKIELLYFKYLSNTFTNHTNKKYYSKESKNYIYRFNVLYQKYETLDNQFDTEYAVVINTSQGRIAWIGIVLGAILGLIGVYYGFNGASSTQLQSNFTDLNKQNQKILLFENDYNSTLLEFNKNLHIKYINLLNIQNNLLKKEDENHNKILQNIKLLKNKDTNKTMEKSSDCKLLN